jgi:hypothetical protein
MRERYTAFILNHPRLVVALSLALAVLLALPAGTLRMTSDYRVFFSAENPELVAFDRFERTYTSNDTALIALRPGSGDIFQNDVLAALDELTARGWQLPHVVRVDSPVNFQRISASGDDIEIGDLMPEAGPRDEAALALLRERALGETLLVGRLLSADGRTAGILLTLQFPGADHAEHLPQSVLAARALVAEAAAKYPDIHFALTGMAPLSHAMLEIMMRELTLLLPVMFAVLTMLLLLLLRSAVAVSATLIVVACAAAAAMGVAGLLGIALTTASVAAPIVILTVAVADCVHLIGSAVEERRDGKNLPDALREAIRINVEPIFLTSLTTVVGFLSLNFSESPPFRDLGNITAAGVVIAWALAMTLLPALLLLFGMRRPTWRAHERGWISNLAEFVVARRRPILFASAFLALASVAAVPLNTLDDRFILWFGKDLPARADADFVADNLTGPYQIEFSLRVAPGGAISDPAYLADVEAFAAWLAAEPGVTHVYALPDVLKRLNRAMHGDDPAWYRLPDNADMAAQYLLLYEFSLPYGLDLNAQIDLGKTASRLTVTILSMSSVEIRKLKARAEAWIATNAAHVAPAEATGTSVMFAFVSKRTIESMLYGTGLALLLISATILIALKSFRLGMLSLLPNILPVTVTFGIWGLLVGEIGIVGSTIAATTLGLVVDDTVHFLSKYHRGREEHGLSTHDGIRFAFEHVGRAMITTTIVLAAGFLVMTWSDFLLNWQMGVLIVMTITTALIMDLFLLPSLLMWLDREEDCPCPTCTAARAAA